MALARILARVLPGAPLCFLIGATLAQAPEPQTYWMGPMQGEVPASLTGGRVIHTEALADMLRGGGIVLVDAALTPHRPTDLAPEAIWKPAPHRNIAGSVWVPGVGAGELEAGMEDYFRERLSALTGRDLERPIVFYCHVKCWASWNAAKRAIEFGYRNVYWYPDGVEGWQDGGHALAAAEPEGPKSAER
jgi:PQQ-dependent catabolism-associated CXXCW motif protein